MTVPHLCDLRYLLKIPSLVRPVLAKFRTNSISTVIKGCFITGYYIYILVYPTN